MKENNLPYSVLNDSIFHQFCQNRDLKDQTVDLYKRNLQRYSDFVGKSLIELLEEAEEEESQHIIFRKRKIIKYLNDFKLYLNDLDISESYKNQIMIQVKAFYNEFEIQLPRPKRSKKKKYYKKSTINDLPKIEEIRKFMEKTNEVYKAIVIMGYSSGMSRAELSSLTFEHLYKALELKHYPKNILELIDKLKDKTNSILKWDVIRIKTEKPYFCFSSPESVDYLLSYFDELYYKFPEYEPKPEDTLFRSLRTNEGLKRYNYTLVFNYVGKANNMRRVDGRFVVRPHTLRKSFATILEKNKVPHLTTRWLMGHDLDGTTSAYFFPDVDSLKADYMEVINELSIQEVKTKTIESKEYKELKDQLELYKESHNEKDKEIDKIQKELEVMRKKNRIVDELLANEEFRKEYLKNKE